MRTENFQLTEQPISEDYYNYPDTLIEQVEQQEQGRFRAFVGRMAARAAIVGAIAGSVLIGQSNHEEAEAAPLAPAVTYCFENGKGGIMIGRECVTPEEEHRDDHCSNWDKFVGNAAVTYVGGMLPISRAASIASAWGVNVSTSHFGDFCD